MKLVSLSPVRSFFTPRLFTLISTIIIIDAMAIERGLVYLLFRKLCKGPGRQGMWKEGPLLTRGRTGGFKPPLISRSSTTFLERVSHVRARGNFNQLHRGWSCGEGRVSTTKDTAITTWNPLVRITVVAVKVTWLLLYLGGWPRRMFFECADESLYRKNHDG